MMKQTPALQPKLKGSLYLRIAGMLMIFLGVLEIMSYYTSFLVAVGAVPIEMIKVPEGQEVTITAMTIVLVTLFMINGIVLAALGFVSVKDCANPDKVPFLQKLGILLVAVTLVVTVMKILSGTFTGLSIMQLIAPILYIVGGMRNKNDVMVKNSQNVNKKK